ncbi:hypothetical protein NC652_030702 [Populus alba x Populus x berolinensis]|nr:hypothetical protein NC652_030702 [Populus alba x Populus x berolinensis]
MSRSPNALNAQIVNLEPFTCRYVSIKSSLRLPDGISHGGKGTLPKIQSGNFTGGSEIFEIVMKCSAMDGRSSSFPVNTVKTHNLTE